MQNEITELRNQVRTLKMTTLLTLTIFAFHLTGCSGSAYQEDVEVTKTIQSDSERATIELGEEYVTVRSSTGNVKIVKLNEHKWGRNNRGWGYGSYYITTPEDAKKVEAYEAYVNE